MSLKPRRKKTLAALTTRSEYEPMCFYLLKAALKTVQEALAVCTA